MEAVNRPRGCGDRSGQRATRLLRSAAPEHLPRPLRDAAIEVVPRHVQSDEERRESHHLTPELPLAWCQRRTRLGELQSTNDPTPVVWVDACRRVGVAFGEEIMHASGAELVIGALPALTRFGGRCRRQIEVDERRAQVEPRTAHDDRRHAVVECRVDRAMRQRGVLADGCLVVEAPDRDKLGRVRGLVREDRDASVDLHRVCGDQPCWNPLGKRLGDGGLARRGRAEDRDDPWLSHGGGRGCARRCPQPRRLPGGSPRRSRSAARARRARRPSPRAA